MSFNIKLPRYFFEASLGILIFISSNDTAWAGEAESNHQGIYGTIFTGINWQASGEVTTVNFGGPNTNRYVANSGSYRPTLWSGIGAGYQWPLSCKHAFWVRFGGELSYTSVLSPYGLVQPLYFISSDFDTLNFNYNTSSLPIFAIGHLGWTLTQWFSPYVLVGLGLSVNHAFNYNEVPTNPVLSAAPMRSMFSNNTNVAFAYSLGVGVNAALSLSGVMLGLEYRFSDFGKANLRPAQLQSTPDRLSLGTIYSHAMLASMTLLTRI